MSNRTAYFGGSPGPPRNERPQFHHAIQLPPQLPSAGVNVYGGLPGASLSTREIGGIDPAYYGHPGGENVMSSNFSTVRMNPYPYGALMDPYYFGASASYYPYPGVQSTSAHFVNTPSPYAYDGPISQSNDYAEWSSNDFSSQSPLADSELKSSGESSQNQDCKGGNNESSGKSRRFSRQRNIKESGEAGKYQLDASDKSQPKKHEIRFSHQRQQNTHSKKVLEREKQTEDTMKDEPDNGDEDSRFSIIRSIGKREVDTGFGESKKNFGDTKQRHDKLKEPKKRNKHNNSQSSESQIGVLLEQLTNGTYECMVCCDRVKQQHAVWNCGKCYHVFHMGCIKKWARSPVAQAEEEGWRCPGCQNVTKKFPSTYNCYCGKVNEPEWNRRETPHSCGEVCGKKRSNNASCTHPCNILCHPGPCPPCPASVFKSCLCGKMTSKVRCSQQKPLMCSEPCGKDKNCALHKCEAVCHSGDCNKCEVVVDQICFCNKAERKILCGSEEYICSLAFEGSGAYSCGGECEKMLACGNHTCTDVCHADECKPCPLLPTAVKTCPCTQTRIADMADEDGNKIVRTTCMDPIPICGKICGKPLKCGGDSIHTCKQQCHTGACLPCPGGETNVRCRCSKSEKDVPCAEIEGEPYVCDRRCNKKRKCGRHKCGKTCCTDTEHICSQICGRKLECKLHRCEETCHRGTCHSCYNVSFEELNCHCGAEVLYPPIPCGTRPPECARTCVRRHACFHPVRHNCHNEEKCPPCVVLVKKNCNCGRLMRNNIPCHQENVSCGAPCKKPLPCGHNCLKPCHQGSCMAEDEKCTQPCSVMRVECIHPCANPCHHSKACPQTPCKAVVTLKCGCGHLEKQMECYAGGATYQRLSSEAFARQQQMSKGNSVDISNLFQGAGNQKVLPCNEECSAIARNRRLADALQIDDQAGCQNDQQLYSPFLQNWAKQDPGFIKGIEQELASIVEAVQWLEQSKRDHPFPSMKREKRQVVHELAETFNCKSLSVDEEPNRSVIVTAVRGISKIPRTLLSESVAKTPDPISYSKRVESQSNPASVDGSKRLLSSMKLVSLTSKSPQAGSKSKLSDSDQATKRPASIPRMPSYSALSKLSSSATPSKSYDYSAKKDYRNSSGGSLGNKAMPRMLPGNQSEPRVTRATDVAQMPQSRNGSVRPAPRAEKKATKEDPEIDYFDMTG